MHLLSVADSMCSAATAASGAPQKIRSVRLAHPVLVRVAGRECRHEAQQRGERPCSALGYCLMPRDPKAANDPQLNEPDAVRLYAVGASQMLAEHWDSLFKVLGPCAYRHIVPGWSLLKCQIAAAD
jgi:hypothetical protein